MRNTALTLMIRDYDFVSPLACGDLAVEGIDLALDRTDDNGTVKRVP